MKRKTIVITLAFIVVFVMSMTGCGGNTSDSAEQPADINMTADCYNGNFTGVMEDNDVISFKGIPYAKAPTGDLRWKAPEPVEESDEDFTADKYGKSSIQYEWHSEGGSYNEIGEDCLTLNVWTKDLDTKGKPVLFYIHGGGFNWGGTADNLYDGKYMAAENEDVVVITSNYRLGAMGLIDFSGVEGGEDFPDSSNLAVLDLIQSLKWVQQNAEAFGGDPENVTIFGESAGGGYVSILTVCDEAQGLFKNGIAQSGSLNLTFSKEEAKEAGVAEMLMQKSGAKNMDELMAIPEEKLIDYITSYDEEGNCVNDLVIMPVRDGNLIPDDPYQALRDGAGKDVNLIVGSNADEWNYWVNEMGEKEMIEMTKKEQKENFKWFAQSVKAEKYEATMNVANDEEKEKVKEYMNGLDSNLKEMWKNSALGTEIAFKQPAIATADAHAEGGGATYMYFFCKRSDNFDWMGACHASECAYIFHNLDETIFSGTVDENLADDMCTMWTNFARNGNPSIDSAEWTQYDSTDRATMVIGDDCSLKMKNDPNSNSRELLGWTVSHYLR